MTLLVSLLFWISSLGFSAEKSLVQELGEINVDQKVPSQMDREKLYSVQTRVLPLKNKFEIGALASQNWSSNGFLRNEQYGGEVRFHFSNRFSLGAAYSVVSNTFTNSAERLGVVQGIYPDVDYAKSRMEIRPQANLFFGKFRISSDQTFYFDQYIGLGAAAHQLKSGQAIGPVGEAGFVFWISTYGALRLGVRDYYYAEKGVMTQGSSHNFFGFVQGGVVL